jgi:hypothetical protein
VLATAEWLFSQQSKHPSIHPSDVDSLVKVTKVILKQA